MNRIVMFILFLVVFVGTYLSMNYYIFYRLYSLFELHKGVTFVFLVSFSTLLYPIASAIGRNFYNIFTRSLNAVAGTYMAFVFILFFALLIAELFRFIPNTNLQIANYTIIGIVILFTLYGIINGFSLVTKELELPINNLKEDVNFVQLSDIHIGSVRNNNYLKKIVDTTNKLNPDFVVITGDLVDGSAKLHQGMFMELNNLKAPVYFIIGNHETYEGVQNVIDVLNTDKIKVLRNELIIQNGIQIVGVDYSEKSNYLQNILNSIKLNKSKPSILLYHAPKDVEVAQKKGFELMLSGHTHNGQVFPFNYIVRLQFKYLKGLYDVEGMKLYVNPGTGMWGPPMRLGSKNEITHFKFLKKE